MAYDPIQIELYQNLRGINEKASEYVVGDGYFLNLRNFGFERPGAIVSRPGTTDFASLGFNTFIAIPRGLAQYSYQNLGAGESYTVFDTGNRLFSLTTTPVQLNASLTANATTSYPFDFISAKNRLYYTNGQVFSHLGVTKATAYSVPGATRFLAGGMSLTDGGLGGQTTILPSGTYVATYSYARAIEGYTTLFTYPGPLGQFEVGERYEGPTFRFVNLANTLVAQSPRLYLDGIQRADFYPDTAPYGVTYVAIWVAYPGETFTFINIIDPSDLNAIEWSISHPLNDTGPEPDQIPNFTLVPRYLEIYKNMLFMSGFSSTPSIVWHSEFDNELVLPENFIEVRTDNGDNITCLKTFQNTLVVFKANSVHEINGDSPETLSLKDMTLEYGCVNNEAAVVFEDRLWFVDKRGICEYAGSNTFMVSDAVNETFKTLDVTKAKAFHVKKRDEVWFSFGSTSLIYNYSNQAWTIYDGFDVQFGIGAEILDYGVSTADLSFMRTGTSHFQLVRFKDDVYSDRGTAITLIAETPYFKRMGDSTQEMFRRFYLDADRVSATLAVTLSIKSNYSDSASFLYSFYLNSFQKRTETAVSAKAVNYTWVLQATEKITVNGYAIHARYLRSV